MRKIIVSNLVSLDGFMAGPNGEIDWFMWNEETAQYAKELAESIDTILFGRVTYELMASFWPTPAADAFAKSSVPLLPRNKIGPPALVPSLNK